MSIVSRIQSVYRASKIRRSSAARFFLLCTSQFSVWLKTASRGWHAVVGATLMIQVLSRSARSGYQVLSGAIRCYQVLSGAIRCYQVLSGAIRCYQVLSGAIRCYQVLSGAIRCYQVLSGNCSPCAMPQSRTAVLQTRSLDLVAPAARGARLVWQTKSPQPAIPASEERGSLPATPLPSCNILVWQRI